MAAKEAGGLSGSYLHKLERDEVRRPSPTIIKKLSSYYGIDYGILMELAGYPPEQAAEKTQPDLPVTARILLKQGLSENEAAILLGVLKLMRREYGRA